MKAKELMIGDWVLYDGSPAEVGLLSDFDMEIVLFRSGEDHPCAEIWDEDDEVQPLPVTPEILEKNDFRKVQDKLGRVLYSIADDYFDLTIDELTDSIWCVEYDNLEGQFPTCRNLVGHVHELQHALRLCGVEKEITL